MTNIILYNEHNKETLQGCKIILCDETVFRSDIIRSIDGNFIVMEKVIKIPEHVRRLMDLWITDNNNIGYVYTLVGLQPVVLFKLENKIYFNRDINTMMKHLADKGIFGALVR